MHHAPSCIGVLFLDPKGPESLHAPSCQPSAHPHYTFENTFVAAYLSWACFCLQFFFLSFFYPAGLVLMSWNGHDFFFFLFFLVEDTTREKCGSSPILGLHIGFFGLGSIGVWSSGVFHISLIPHFFCYSLLFPTV